MLSKFWGSLTVTNPGSSQILRTQQAFVLSKTEVSLCAFLSLCFRSHGVPKRNFVSLATSLHFVATFGATTLSSYDSSSPCPPLSRTSIIRSREPYLQVKNRASPLNRARNLEMAPTMNLTNSLK